MQAIVAKAVEGLALAPPQQHGGAAVLPIVGVATAPGPDYLTLAEALLSGLFTVTEVSEGGSVPQLAVHNAAERPVLILDGEELAGAKQNRVVNASILVREKSVTTIPVSCTEQGRWHYRTRAFEDSEIVMHHRARALKSRSVSASLKGARGFQSDQGEVWESVAELHAGLGTDSPTGAMRDAFAARADRLRHWEEVFVPVEGQMGMAFILGGHVLGVEFVSRATAYARLHHRLLRSYVIDADLAPDSVAGAAAPGKVLDAFLAQLGKLEEHSHASIGYGTDWRYEGLRACGAALVHEDACIHAAFFSTPEARQQREDNPPEYGPRIHRRHRGPIH